MQAQRILFTHGTRQRFRLRSSDITVRGRVRPLALPLDRAAYVLNGGTSRPLYVEQTPDDGVDWLNGYKASPAELRCRDVGEFCIEIPVEAEGLAHGVNHVEIEVVDALGRCTADLWLRWDPTPIPLPLDLRDLRGICDVQEIGQAVNGAFDVDPFQNVIRSRAPAAPDSFLILGSPHGSQEATYAVRFTETVGAKWLGLSDFYVGQEEGDPPRGGIKVGWSSAGMAALSPKGEARSFIAWGDHSARPEEWAVATNPPRAIAIERDRLYRVRHQVILEDGIDRVRFRIWPDSTPEPAEWLCDESDLAVPDHLPRHSVASFGLFQHMGMPIEWSNILVKSLSPAREELEGAPERAPFLGRDRPGAF